MTVAHDPMSRVKAYRGGRYHQLGMAATVALVDDAPVLTLFPPGDEWHQHVRAVESIVILNALLVFGPRGLGGSENNAYGGGGFAPYVTRPAGAPESESVTAATSVALIAASLLNAPSACDARAKRRRSAVRPIGRFP